MHLQLTPVSGDKLGEGVRVAGLCPGDQIGVDANPSVPTADCGVSYLYRRRATRESGTPAQFAGRGASASLAGDIRN